MHEHIILRRRFSKPVSLQGYERRGRLDVDAKLCALGEQAPYFSVTGEEKCNNGQWVACGCLHESIAKHFPDTRPAIALHLCDENGRPMHAEANGAYWLELAAGISKWQECADKDERARGKNPAEVYQRRVMGHFRIGAAAAEVYTARVLFGESAADVSRYICGIMGAAWGYQAQAVKNWLARA